MNKHTNRAPREGSSKMQMNHFRDGVASWPPRKIEAKTTTYQRGRARFCSAHDRWIQFGDMARRCPECPPTKGREFMHLPTGRVLRPEPFGAFVKGQR
jgi:hypothetical protein